MQFGILVLSLIVLIDFFFMVFVMRMVLTEPPHKEPAQHPFALEYGVLEEPVETTVAAPAETTAAAPAETETAETAEPTNETGETNDQ